MCMLSVYSGVYMVYFEIFFLAPVIITPDGLVETPVVIWLTPGGSQTAGGKYYPRRIGRNASGNLTYPRRFANRRR